MFKVGTRVRFSKVDISNICNNRGCENHIGSTGVIVNIHEYGYNVQMDKEVVGFTFLGQVPINKSMTKIPRHRSFSFEEVDMYKEDVVSRILNEIDEL